MTPMTRQARPKKRRIRRVRDSANIDGAKPMTLSMAPSLMPIVVHTMPFNKWASWELLFDASIRF